LLLASPIEGEADLVPLKGLLYSEFAYILDKEKSIRRSEQFVAAKTARLNRRSMQPVFASSSKLANHSVQGLGDRVSIIKCVRRFFWGASITNSLSLLLFTINIFSPEDSDDDMGDGGGFDDFGGGGGGKWHKKCMSRYLIVCDDFVSCLAHKIPTTISKTLRTLRSLRQVNLRKQILCCPRVHFSIFSPFH
jgi:hypothetical protein